MAYGVSAWHDAPVKVRAPATIYLRRAQAILLLVAVVPTILATPMGIILLASGGSDEVALVSGVLVLAFCASAIVGYVLGSRLLRRSASLVDTQNQFLSAVSHELRTPMTSMRMFIEALLDDRLTDRTERDRCLSSLRHELLRLDDLVGRLIALSRAESAQQPYQRVPVAADDVVGAAMQALDAIKLDAPASISVDVPPGLRVLGDRAALIQVFANLLSNAWKHGQDPRRIGVVVRAASPKEVLFEVTDNGPGIAEAERQRVFEMFERGAATIGKGTGGSGVGLAIVHAIVERHQGRIELDSGPDGGCRFRVFLPRIRERAARPAMVVGS